MTHARPGSRHANRLAAALCSTFIAAGAMAYATGGLQHHPKPQAGEPAAAGGAHGGGGTVLESQAGGADAGDGGGDSGVGVGGAAGGGTFTLADGAPHGAFGPGEDRDGPTPGGFMPNGENGLMMLADYAQRGAEGRGQHNGDNDSEHTPGVPPGGVAAQDGADGLSLPGGDGGPGAPDAQGDAGKMSGGFGFPGFGGGGGGYAGGAGGGGGSGGAGGGLGGPGGSAGNGGTGLVGGGVTNPLGGDPQTGPATGPATGPGASGGGGVPPLNICVVTALETCGHPTGTPSSPPPSAGSPATGPNAVPVMTPVPEASIWLMMILGFAGTGSLLRVQRQRTAWGTLG